MVHHHEPFKALGPIDWAEIAAQQSSDTLPSFLSATFASAQTIVDSIPEPPKSAATSTGRARAQTDSAALAPHVSVSAPHPTTGDAELAAKIKKDWKEVKVGPKENPMDGRGWGGEVACLSA
ncbi:hypothetical protein CONLIGDRAFT_187013 [Coniochaeta ligniaria NRRL 30616]|uniref:Uncharacterized protein n=1 Tax=Coniochaeta ligniaria NRRL 30616 TaxID=1408157 RepID=A0A1J7JUE8_9PEZI|nr:hypothetical protein CONLIGDRAFT_187013 [Coniochaeta ligniaria NRRL 30616]